MGEEKRTPADEGPERDEGEPTPIFDAVFSATRANTPNPAREPGKTGR
ncbi:hypothetical protein [Amycolatopsis balhimycina]|nr:hypothetical protein [Amycolatopsis balhimycina]